MSNRMRRQAPPPFRTTAASRAQAAARAAERERTRSARRWLWVGGSVATAAVILGVAAFVVTRPTHEAPVPSKEAVSLGCASCHSVDGGRSEGPTWKGLYGSTVMLSDGTTVTVDDEYLRQSILDPQAQVASGYPTAMPTIAVTDAQLEELVAYIKTLRD
jgi:cytochrome c oxidase subunit 2